MKESIERVKETTESLTAKEEKLDDEINDTCDQLVIGIFFMTIIMRGWDGFTKRAFMMIMIIFIIKMMIFTKKVMMIEERRTHKSSSSVL